MNRERRIAVLGAIVQDYVQTSEPVGSKALLDRHQLGVSAATIRNDMAALEDEGLIVAPHTSAGRVPTDAGYRMFVDRLSQIKPMSRAEQAAIAQYLSNALDLDDVVDRTVRLLASLTRQVAVMQYPSLSRSSVRHIELVPLGGARVMFVLIATSGRVEQRVLDTGHDLDAPGGAAFVARLRDEINGRTAGQLLAAAAAALQALPDVFEPAQRDAVRAVVAAELYVPEHLRPLYIEIAEDFTEALQPEGILEKDACRQLCDNRFQMERVRILQANLARTPADFPLTLEPVLEALEQHVVLLRLLSVGAPRSNLAVRIGQENPYTELQSTSMVSTTYGPGSDIVGGIGVVGPTRMDYPTSMAAVRTVAAYVSTILAS